MIVTLLRHRVHSWSVTEHWIIRLGDFVDRHNGQIFHDISVWQPVIIYADAHPDEATLEKWFAHSGYRINEVEVIVLDNAPDGLNVKTIFQWVDSALKKIRTS